MRSREKTRPGGWQGVPPRVPRVPARRPVGPRARPSLHGAHLPPGPGPTATRHPSASCPARPRRPGRGLCCPPATPRRPLGAAPGAGPGPGPGGGAPWAGAARRGRGLEAWAGPADWRGCCPGPLALAPAQAAFSSTGRAGPGRQACARRPQASPPGRGAAPARQDSAARLRCRGRMGAGTRAQPPPSQFSSPLPTCCGGAIPSLQGGSPAGCCNLLSFSLFRKLTGRRKETRLHELCKPWCPCFGKTWHQALVRCHPALLVAMMMRWRSC